jgi:hypothetical protein
VVSCLVSPNVQCGCLATYPTSHYFSFSSGLVPPQWFEKWS